MNIHCFIETGVALLANKLSHVGLYSTVGTLTLCTPRLSWSPLRPPDSDCILENLDFI